MTTRDEFYQMLEKQDLEVTFVKKTDGTTRVLRCTAHVPEDIARSGVDVRRLTTPETLITVFDTEAKGWRSFYSDTIQEIKPLQSTFGLLQE